MQFFGWKVVKEMVLYSFGLPSCVSALRIEYFVEKGQCLRKL